MDGISPHRHIRRTDDAAWREDYELKLFSQIRPIRAFQSMLKESRGAIVTVNSLLAYQPEAHMVCTLSARSSVQNLLKSLGVGPRLIEVNMIAIRPFAVFFFGPPAGAAGNPT